jgi:hypothetical protein
MVTTVVLAWLQLPTGSMKKPRYQAATPPTINHMTRSVDPICIVTSVTLSSQN